MPRGRATVLLAGGRGSRLGGTDKAALRLGEVTLLQSALTALRGARVVVVGPPHLAATPAPMPFVVVREEPAFAGPAAAIAAGVTALVDSAVASRDTLVLPVDLPRLPEVMRALIDAPLTGDGLVAQDDDGRPVPIAGRYRTAALRRAVVRLGDPAGRSVRELVAGLELTPVPVPAGALLDVDTVADARRAGIAVPEGDPMADDDLGRALDDWEQRLVAALGLDGSPADRDAVLGLAGQAAHAVVRPAAPITTFLVGLAAGRAGGSPDDVADAIAKAKAALKA
jgi:molybdopterin-guanine dinucleotide biosynthesis protein A